MTSWPEPHCRFGFACFFLYVSPDGKQAAWTTSVIALTLGTKKKGESGYHRCDITDGNLTIIMYELSNISYIGNDLAGKLGDASGLSLLAALDVKKYEEERNELLQTIQADTQLAADVTLDIDQVAFAAFIDKVWKKVGVGFLVLTTREKAGYKDRVGEFIVDILKALKGNLSSSFKDDELARAALQVSPRFVCVFFDEKTSLLGRPE
jgi:hypothetical protein